jgi:uncharacterized membrane protein (DUF106 family)
MMDNPTLQTVSAIIGAVIVLGGVIVGFYTTVHVRLKALEIEVGNLQKSQEKTDSKFDRIMDKLEDISKELSGKQDKTSH